MLRRIELRNFRSCRDVVLDDLGPSTLLVGRNAAGKSNILRGIQWLAGVATSTNFLLMADSHPRSDISANAVVDGHFYEYSVRLDVEHESNGLTGVRMVESLQSGRDPSGVVFRRNGDSLQYENGQRMQIGGWTSCMQVLLSLLPDSSPTLKLIRPLFSLLNGLRYYPMDGEDDNHPSIISEFEYDSWLRQYRATGIPGSSVVLRLLHLALTKEPLYDEIISLLGSDGLALVKRIDLARFAGDGDANGTGPAGVGFYRLRFETNGMRAYEELSAGTQRVIRILVSVLFDRSSVALLEHPEDGIHRGLLRKLIGLLQTYSDQSQLIISSHSPAVLNAFEPEAVRLVTMKDEETQVRKLTAEELGIAERFLEEEGDLSDFVETVDED